MTAFQGGHIKNTRYAGPGYAVSIPIHRLPVRELAVTKHPFSLSFLYQPCLQNDT